MEEIIRALKKKAEEGKHLLRHFNSSNINTDNIIVIPDRWAEDIYWEDVDTNIEIGVGIDKPLILDKPIFIEQIPYGVFSRSGRKAIIFGACLGGACIFLGDIPLSEDEREIANANNGKITSQWSGKRYGITPGILKNSIAVDIKLSGAREKVSSFFQKENLEYEWLLDVEAPNDLKKHIELIREVTEHKLPIIVRMGSENVYNNVKDAIAFGADAIQISGMECWGNAIPDFVAKSFDSPVIATFAPAIRALRETNAKEKGIKLIVSGGFFSGENIFKAIALGADAICLDNAARIAIGCKLCGKCYEGRCEEGIATLDPLLEARLDWKKAGRKLANYIEIINKEIKVLTALAGKKSIKELDRSILRALNYDTAAITGIPLLGYEKELPMWLH